MSQIEATQLKLAEFNDAPGAEAAAKILNEWHVGDWAEVSEGSRDYWQNDEATIVLRVRGTDSFPNFIDGLNFGKALNELRPDEFDTMRDYDVTLIRLWWD